MFWIVIALLLLMLGAIGIYIARRVCQGIALLIPKARFGVTAALILLPAAVMLLGFCRSMLPFGVEIRRFFGFAAAYTVGIFLYLMMYIVAGDLLILIFRLLKWGFVKKLPYKRAHTLAVLGLTLITALGGFLHVRNIQHVSYEIPLARKADVSDMNIVLISDLHLGAVGSEERLEEVVSRINALEPDIVCIAGDFFDSDYGAILEHEKARNTLLTIRSTYGVYACLGNHDAGSSHRQMLTFLEESGIQALRDEYVVIDERLVLVGRLDGSPIGGYDGAGRVPLSQIVIREDPSLPVIVMDHNPAHIDEYTGEADLILSGHTHNGQLFPATIVTQLMYTVDYGYYQKDAGSPHIIVTSGVGYWGMPLRVGTDCEIVSIRLTHPT